MKILLAADGSEFTRNAARHLVKLVRLFAQPPEIHVVHVHPQIPFPGAAAAAGKSAVENYQREESEAALGVATRELEQAGVEYRSAWLVGDVADRLAHYVKTHGIDLVVMGSHGKGMLANIALGSVAMKCIATLEAPVMIVRHPPSE
jgi:nucleotide-binding universal stress UspA family protein